MKLYVTKILLSCAEDSGSQPKGCGPLVGRGQRGASPRALVEHLNEDSKF